jgi:hypothetical protein
MVYVQGFGVWSFFSSGRYQSLLHVLYILLPNQLPHDYIILFFITFAKLFLPLLAILLCDYVRLFLLSSLAIFCRVRCSGYMFVSMSSCFHHISPLSKGAIRLIQCVACSGEELNCANKSLVMFDDSLDSQRSGLVRNITVC